VFRIAGMQVIVAAPGVRIDDPKRSGMNMP
jgi:hypothetical protein